MPTSYAAAAYLRSLGFAGPGGRRVFLLGNRGMEEELSDAGIDFCTFDQLCSDSSDSDGDGGGGSSCSETAAAFAQGWTADAFADLQLDERIGAVLVGWDPSFDYLRLSYASACVRELPDCMLIATNLDSADKMGKFPLGCIQGGAPASGPAATRVSPFF